MTPASSQGTSRADKTEKLGLSSLEISLMAGGTMLLLVFMYLMRDMLHPPILAAAGMILLLAGSSAPPRSSHSFHRRIFINYLVLFHTGEYPDSIWHHLSARLSFQPGS